jgi:hypothetical protein
MNSRTARSSILYMVCGRTNQGLGNYQIAGSEYNLCQSWRHVTCDIKVCILQYHRSDIPNMPGWVALEGWVAKSVARQLATAALWVRIQTSLENHKWAT